MSDKRPNIFSYHDYQKFLRDWLAFKKASPSRVSMRALAKAAGLASGYLPMVTSKKRPLSHAAWVKLAPHLGLSPSEKIFFENLLTLGTSDLHDRRVEALDKMKRSSRYARENPKEAEVYQYLTHWYYVAIRELAGTPDFNEEPQWIQSQLKYPVPLAEIKQAFEFLLKNGFLERDFAGKIRPPVKALDCSGGVYRIALGQFHKEILDLAAKSIDSTTSEERSLMGHTFKLGAESFPKAEQIVRDAIEQIQNLSTESQGNSSVYHMEVALFPLSETKRSAK